MKKEKTNKIRISKGQFARRIMAALLVALMILPIFATCIFYIISYFGK